MFLPLIRLLRAHCRPPRRWRGAALAFEALERRIVPASATSLALGGLQTLLNGVTDPASAVDPAALGTSTAFASLNPSPGSAGASAPSIDPSTLAAVLGGVTQAAGIPDGEAVPSGSSAGTGESEAKSALSAADLGTLRAALASLAAGTGLPAGVTEPTADAAGFTGQALSGLPTGGRPGQKSDATQPKLANLLPFIDSSRVTGNLQGTNTGAFDPRLLPTLTPRSLDAIILAASVSASAGQLFQDGRQLGRQHDDGSPTGTKPGSSPVITLEGRTAAEHGSATGRVNAADQARDLRVNFTTDGELPPETGRVESGPQGPHGFRLDLDDFGRPRLTRSDDADEGSAIQVAGPPAEYQAADDLVWAVGTVLLPGGSATVPLHPTDIRVLDAIFLKSTSPPSTLAAEDVTPSRPGMLASERPEMTAPGSDPAGAIVFLAGLGALTDRGGPRGRGGKGTAKHRPSVHGGPG